MQVFRWTCKFFFWINYTTVYPLKAESRHDKFGVPGATSNDKVGIMTTLYTKSRQDATFDVIGGVGSYLYGNQR